MASDASPSFGLGLTRARVGPRVVRQIGRLALHGDTHVRPASALGDEVEKPRLGTCIRLPVTRQQFQPLISSRARYHAHAGTLELVAANTALRWLSRSVGNLARRATLLIDARAAMFALRKGRSSAPHFNREVRRASALALTMDIAMHHVYIPSEGNPADAPSRGKGIVAWCPLP